MHQNFEVKLIYHYCISIKHCGDKITGDVFFHEILLKFPHTFHTVLICSVRYDTFSIRYDTFLARYDMFLLVYQSRMLLMRFFMCSSAFQDLYHLRLLHIIVCVQNEQSSKHVIDMKLEINKKSTALQFFALYLICIIQI